MTGLAVDEQGWVAGTAAPFAADRTAQAEIALALAELGEVANRTVRWGQTKFFADHLGWPDWLLQSTSLAGRSPSNLPGSITVRDDMLVLANIIDAGRAPEIVALLAREERLPGSPSVALALMAESTLGATLERVSRKIAADNPQMLADLVLDDECVRLRIGYKARLGRVDDLMSTLALVTLKQVIKAVAPNAMLELTQEIRPAMVALQAAISGSWDGRLAIVADPGPVSLTLPARWFHFPNSVYDPALKPLIEAAFERSGNRDTEEKVHSDRIRARIAMTLDSGRVAPRLKQVARDVGIPTRTVVRRLRREGTSFRELVDDERRRRAIVLVADPHILLKEAAEQLGFPDASSFSRAFRRWYGTSPGNYRNLRGEPERHSRITK